MASGPGILTPEIQNYLNESGLREPDLLRELREETAKRWRGFLLEPATGQLLYFLMRLIRAERVLDVGCFTGYSALVAAFACGPKAKIITMDINEEWTALAREYWSKAKIEDKIDLKLQPALTTLDELIAQNESGKFDFAFIDADKGNYASYLDRAHQLVRADGLIVLDNVLWKGEVANPQTQDKAALTFRELNQKLQKDSRFDFMLLSVGDGVTVLRKR